MKELVSIIVPVYNCEKYLEECITSLINQDYPNIEIILVNDGSKDNSGQICDYYAGKDNRVRVIHKKNEGVSSARNRGIAEAKGTWLTFVDADDWVTTDYVRYLLENAIDSKADISLTDFPNKVTSSKRNNQRITKDFKRTLSGVDAAIEMLYYKIVISSWNKMFKKEILERSNVLFNTSLAYGEGFEFVINAMCSANSVFIGKKRIYNYRVDNAQSAMTVFKEELVTGSITAQRVILERIKSDFEKNTDNFRKLSRAWEYSNWHTYCDCLNTIYGSGAFENKQLIKQVSAVCRRSWNFIFCDSVPKKDRAKALIYLLSPRLGAFLINKVRLRKFNRDI